MANGLYFAYKAVRCGDNAVAGFSVPDLEGDDIRGVLIDVADDDPVLATDQDLADIASAARVSVAALSGEAVSNPSGATMAFSSSTVTHTAVTGDQAEEYTLYMHTGTEGTSLLIVNYDTFTSGMPVTPNGGDISVAPAAAGWWSE